MLANVPNPSTYCNANVFIRNLRDYQNRLTDQQIRRLRNLALRGELEEAYRVLFFFTDRIREGNISKSI